MHRLEFRAMGCQMLAVLDAPSPEPLAEVPGWFEEWEQHLSRFRDDSELNQINRRAGQPMQVSQPMWEVVGAALNAAHWSDGLVSPTLLDAVEAAGYDRSFEAVQPIDLSARSIRIRPDGQWRAIKRLATARSIQLPIGVRLDLGGIAKGWAADQAVQRLSEHGPALVDAGGDIAISQPLTDGQPWPIGVTNPFHPDQPLQLLMVGQGGVATSGRDYRRWQRNGVWQHHIIDPRTGLPAKTDVLSATVVASTTSEAEAAAKAALILGSDAGLDWLEAHPSCAGLLVLEDGQVSYSSRIYEYLWQ